MSAKLSTIANASKRTIHSPPALAKASSSNNKDANDGAGCVTAMKKEILSELCNLVPALTAAVSTNRKFRI